MVALVEEYEAKEEDIKEAIESDHECHTPDPGPTRFANPNRFRGAKPYTGTFFFFFNQQSFTFKNELPPEWYPLKFIHIY